MLPGLRAPQANPYAANGPMNQAPEVTLGHELLTFYLHLLHSIQSDDKFKILWTGIANFFKDEPKQLLFDVLNEPEGKMGQWSGAGFPLPTDATAIALTRQIDKVAYKRNTGNRR